MNCMGLLSWLPSRPAVVSRVVLVTSHQLGRVRSAWRQCRRHRQSSHGTPSVYQLAAIRPGCGDRGPIVVLPAQVSIAIKHQSFEHGMTAGIPDQIGCALPLHSIALYGCVEL